MFLAHSHTILFSIDPPEPPRMTFAGTSFASMRKQARSPTWSESSGDLPQVLPRRFAKRKRLVPHPFGPSCSYGIWPGFRSRGRRSDHSSFFSVCRASSGASSALDPEATHGFRGGNDRPRHLCGRIEMSRKLAKTRKQKRYR